MVGQSVGGCQEHRIRYTVCFRGYDAQADRGENVDVVALGDGDGTAVVDYRSERGAGGYQSSAIGPADQVFRSGFGTLGWIRERQNYWALGLAGHFADDGLGEGAVRGG